MGLIERLRFMGSIVVLCVVIGVVGAISEINFPGSGQIVDSTLLVLSFSTVWRRPIWKWLKTI